MPHRVNAVTAACAGSGMALVLSLVQLMGGVSLGAVIVRRDRSARSGGLVAVPVRGGMPGHRSAADRFIALPGAFPAGGLLAFGV